MKWFLIDQLRLFIGTLVLAATGFIALLGWSWLASVPWLSVALHTSLAKFASLGVAFGGMAIASWVSQRLFVLTGIPLKLERSDPEEKPWQVRVIVVCAGIMWFFTLEYGMSSTFLHHLGTALEPSARAAIQTLRPALEIVFPIVEPHPGALAVFLAVSYCGLLVLPGFEVMIVLRRLFRISREN